MHGTCHHGWVYQILHAVEVHNSPHVTLRQGYSLLLSDSLMLVEKIFFIPCFFCETPSLGYATRLETPFFIGFFFPCFL